MKNDTAYQQFFEIFNLLSEETMAKPVIFSDHFHEKCSILDISRDILNT